MNKEVHIFDAGRLSKSLTTEYLATHLKQIGVNSVTTKSLSRDVPLILITIRSPYPSAAHILHALNEAKIPIYSKERDESYPLIVCGGMAMRNPFFMDRIFDAAWLGDACPGTFEALNELGTNPGESKQSKLDLLKKLGYFVPKFNGSAKPIFHNNANYDFSHVIDGHLSIVEFSQDRSMKPTAQVEVKRGCGKRCTFCVDSHAKPQLMDFSEFELLLNRLLDYQPDIGNLRISYPELSSFGFLTFLHIAKRSISAKGKDVTINIGSTAPYQFTPEVARELALLGQKTMTFAPEVADKEVDGVNLRRLNKKWFTDKSLLGAIENGVKAGLRRLVLYHLTGFPLETDGHLEAYANLVREIQTFFPGLDLIRIVSNPVFMTVDTPLEKAPQIPYTEVQRRFRIMRELLKDIPSVEFRTMLDLKVGTFYDKPHSAEVGYQQAYFQRASSKMNIVLMALASMLPNYDSYLLITNRQIETLMVDSGINVEEYFNGKEIITSENIAYSCHSDKKS